MTKTKRPKSRNVPTNLNERKEVTFFAFIRFYANTEDISHTFLFLLILLEYFDCLLIFFIGYRCFALINIFFLFLLN